MRPSEINRIPMNHQTRSGPLRLCFGDVREEEKRRKINKTEVIRSAYTWAAAGRWARPCSIPCVRPRARRWPRRGAWRRPDTARWGNAPARCPDSAAASSSAGGTSAESPSARSNRRCTAQSQNKKKDACNPSFPDEKNNGSVRF